MEKDSIESNKHDQRAPSSIGSSLLLALWFGAIGGVVEGLGLLAFQWINWANWGKFFHVSIEIVWISATLDLVFFSLIALVLASIFSCIRRVQGLSAAFVVLATLTFYDWIELTHRLSRPSALMLGAGLAVALNRAFTKHQQDTLEFLRRNVKWVGLGLLALVVGIQGGRELKERLFVSRLPAPPPGAPNVLIIVVDTLRADHLSSYGYGLATSPHLDRFAESGVLFENAFATSSWTLPSHASLLTGAYPHEHGVTDIKGRKPFDHRLPTIAESFSQHGYRTGAFSANTVYFTRDMGFGRGFAHFEDYFSSLADAVVRTLYGKEIARQVLGRRQARAVLARLGFPHFQELDNDDDYSLSSENLGLSIKRRAPNVNRALLDWVQRDRSRPWFAFLNYMDVHPPYRAPSQGREIRAQSKRELLTKLYDSDIQDFDRSFNNLLQALGERNVLQNTMIVFTSDHGEMFGEHGLYRHQNALYKEVLHVPLIIWKPGTVPAIRVRRAVTNADIPATLIDLLGWSGESHFPGTSLREAWANPEQDDRRRPVLSEMDQFKYRPVRFPCHSGPLKSLVAGNLHYVFHKKLGSALYDLAADPREEHNLLEDGSQRDLASKFEYLLQVAMSGARSPAAVAKSDGLSPTVIGANTKTIGVVQAGLRYQLYELSIAPGKIEKLQLISEPTADGAQADPVLSILAQDGQPLNTCRNPGDDNPPSGIAPDPTPDAYDDLCVNDDAVPGVNTTAELSFMMPTESVVPEKVFVQVADWDGRPLSGLRMQLVTSEEEKSRSQQKASVSPSGGE